MGRQPPRPLWLAAWLWATWVECAEAYVDPGTGALLLQLLLAAFVGFFFYVWKLLRSVAKKVVEFCLGRRTRDR